MASINTLHRRRWEMRADRWLKGFYFWAHKPGAKGTPYKRTFAKEMTKTSRKFDPEGVMPDASVASWPKK